MDQTTPVSSVVSVPPAAFLILWRSSKDWDSATSSEGRCEVGSREATNSLTTACPGRENGLLKGTSVSFHGREQDVTVYAVAM